MALEPITRKEQIISGKDLEPITRAERFLKQYGGSGGVFDIIVSATDPDDYSTYTADKTPTECFEAYNAGKILRVYLDWYGGMYAILEGVYPDDNYLNFVALMFGSDLGLWRITYGINEGEIAFYRELYTVGWKTTP